MTLFWLIVRFLANILRQTGWFIYMRGHRLGSMAWRHLPEETQRWLNHRHSVMYRK